MNDGLSFTSLSFLYGVHFLDCSMATVTAQRLSSETPSYTHFSKDIFNLPRGVPLTFPVSSFAIGDRIRVVLSPSFVTNHKFDIDLKSGSEVILRFEARTLMDEGDTTFSAFVVFNTRHKGAWESGEQSADRCPFYIAQVYTIDFAPSGHYSIYVRVNGRTIHEFRERHLGFKVSSFEIAGDIEVHSIHLP
ncbi:hypothetical protein RB195_008650 [Necator americanus]|uniref:Galectin n=2 Tax=Necator americanus TaxID=51031 RepID=A0ABR1CS80_NECAM